MRLSDSTTTCCSWREPLSGAAQCALRREAGGAYRPRCGGSCFRLLFFPCSGSSSSRDPDHLGQCGRAGEQATALVVPGDLEDVGTSSARIRSRSRMKPPSAGTCFEVSGEEWNRSR